MGHARAVHLVGDEDEVAAVEVADPERVAYLTQTTLSVDETAGVIGNLRERFPALAGPAPTTSTTPPRTGRPRSRPWPGTASWCW